MPCRNRENLGKFFPSTPTTSNNQASLFINGYELEEPLGKQPDIYQEPIGEEKKRNPFLLNQW